MKIMGLVLLSMISIISCKQKPGSPGQINTAKRIGRVSCSIKEDRAAFRRRELLTFLDKKKFKISKGSDSVNPNEKLTYFIEKNSLKHGTLSGCLIVGTREIDPDLQCIYTPNENLPSLQGSVSSTLLTNEFFNYYILNSNNSRDDCSIWFSIFDQNNIELDINKNYKFLAPRNYPICLDNKCNSLVTISGNQILINNIGSKVKKILNGHKDFILSMAIMKNKEYIITGAMDGEIIIWNVKKGTIKKRFQLKKPITSLLITKDNNKIVTASSDGSIDAINIDLNFLMKLFVPKHTTVKKHSKNITSLILTDNNTMLISGSKDKKIIVWKIDFNKNPIELKVEKIINTEKEVTALAISEIDSLIIAALKNMKVYLWSYDGKLKGDPQYPRLRPSDPPPRDIISSIIVSKKDNKIISGSWNRLLGIWEIKSDQLIYIGDQSTLYHGNRVKIVSLDQSIDGNRLVVRSRNNNYYIWDRFDDTKIFDSDESYLSRLIYQNKNFHLKKFLIFKKKPYNIATALFQNIELWKKDGTKIKSYKGHHHHKFDSMNISSIISSNDGKLLVSSGANFILLQEFKDNGKLNKSHKIPLKRPYPIISISDDKKKLLIAGKSKNKGSAGQKFYDISNIEKPDLKQEITIKGEVNAATYFEKKDIFVVGHTDGFVNFWTSEGKEFKIKPGEKQLKIEAHKKSINTLSTKGEDLIFTGSEDHTIKIWEIKDDIKLVKTLYGHRSGVNSIIHLDDLIISGSNDFTVRLWDLNSINDAKLNITFSVNVFQIDAYKEVNKIIFAGIGTNFLEIYEINETKRKSRIIATQSKKSKKTKKEYKIRLLAQPKL